MMKKIVFLWGVLCLLVCACGRKGDSPEGKLIEYLKSPGNVSEVSLHEMVDFDWDSMYYFMPYTDKETVEKALGFSSDEISDNLSGDDGVYLLFVKGRKVVCRIQGLPENLGFRFDFGKMDTYVKIDKKEKAPFSVEKEGEVVTYTLKG